MPRVSWPAEPASERKHGVSAVKRSGSSSSSRICSRTRLVSGTSAVGMSQKSAFSRALAQAVRTRPIVACSTQLSDPLVEAVLDALAPVVSASVEDASNPASQLLAPSKSTRNRSSQTSAAEPCRTSHRPHQQRRLHLGVAVLLRVQVEHELAERAFHAARAALFSTTKREPESFAAVSKSICRALRPVRSAPSRC